ncbi:hypothetical protein PFICI_08248 [Pestalotiopsis fici W106-1]|uniref:Uncharacterized protein n=1 Tax=Pestalotiopsis fici (strain W106-1 / CGMCC3.15140) TaxID=1229662 RepID=W3X406_PESFW|nr:uncharacterized protein PFICI_08248 [Pestalotiopsis fici W106-1]ETS80719.1 hypothetical protein PFICI_08248 [Pestalotiopsis fici W106-1]
MSCTDSLEYQDANKSEHEHQGIQASKNQFSFNEEFDVFLKKLATSPDGKQDASVVSSRLITYHDLQDKAAQDGYSLRSLPLSKLSSSFGNGYFCLKSMDMARVDSSMSLQDYKDREIQSDNGEKGHQSMNVYWTRDFQGDLKKVLKDVSETGKLPKDEREPFKPEAIPDYKSALSTEQSIKMEKPKEKDSLYGLSQDNWSHIIEGNQLLYAFQVNEELVDRLHGQSLQDFLAVKPSKATESNDAKTTEKAAEDSNQSVDSNDAKTTEKAAEDSNQSVDSMAIHDEPNVSAMSTVNSVVPISRSTRPVFIINPDSGIGSSGKKELESSKIHAGLFWSSPNILSTTEIIKVEDTVQQWSIQSGMSSKSFTAGISFPIGKASVGAKFGFEREQINENEQKKAERCSTLTAVHLIPTAQININETTVLLSPDAEADIKKLRQKRRFSDLFTFLMKYGMKTQRSSSSLSLTVSAGTQVYQTVTLGGQLYHAQSLNTSDAQQVQEQKNRVKKSMNASLGIPDFVEVTTGYSKEDSNTKVEGNREIHTTENLSWSGIGGNPTLIVDPPKWRESLNEYTNWRPIRYETPVRIDTFIGRIQGYSDVPVLFSEILSTGVFNRSIASLSPVGLQRSDDKSSYLVPTPGMIINATTGTTLPSSTSLSTIQTEVTPGGYSWAVYAKPRGIQQEIRAELQSTLNFMVNIHHHARYLKDLCADTDSFSILLKWTSSSVRDSFIVDVEPNTQKSENDRTELKKASTQLEAAKETQKNAETAWEQDRSTLEKDKASWPAWQRGTPAEQQKAKDQKKQFDDAKAKRDKEKANNDKQVAMNTGRLAYARVLGLTGPDDNADKNMLLLRSVTSEAWIVGLWTIRRQNPANAPSKKSGNSKETSLSIEDFEDLKSAFVRRFSGPQGIEGGCDFINDTLRTRSQAVVKFSMFASDGIARQEAEVHSKIDPRYAFDFIDRRISLSSIHYLAVSGEIAAAGGGPLPLQGYMPEAILLQYQEALACLIFLQTQKENVKDSKKKLLKSIQVQDAAGAQKQLTEFFETMYKLEVKKKKED